MDSKRLMVTDETSKSREDDTTLIYWLCQIGGWGIFCAFQAWSSVRFLHLPAKGAYTTYALYMLLLVVATHALRAYSAKHHWTHLPPHTLMQRALSATLALSTAIIVAGAFVGTLLKPLGVQIQLAVDQPRHLTVAVAFVNTFGILLVWMAIYFGFAVITQRQHLRAEEARLRASLRTAELNLLKSQLNPHFLFNALNTVRALIAESPQRAEKAVTQLARTLRYSLNSSRDELVTLANELEIVDDYLGIEELRLADRLTVIKDIAADALQVRIPIMLLQTLVENAVKHGISQLPKGGTLRIVARVQNSMLVIEVSNDRPLIKSGSIPSDRVGLANAHERLRLMIGPTAKLTLDLSAPEKAVATVRIPQSRDGRSAGADA